MKITLPNYLTNISLAREWSCHRDKMDNKVCENNHQQAKLSLQAVNRKLLEVETY